MTTSSEQPSFNSSTYKTFAGNEPLTPSGDRPLFERPDIQTFLKAPDSSPISEVLLYRLLTVSELYLRQHFPEKQLSGLCIGYFLITKEKVNLHYVGWGWMHEYEARLNELINEKDSTGQLKNEFLATELSPEDIESLEQANPNEAESIELRKLAGWIEEELNQQATYPLNLGQLQAFVLNHFSFAAKHSESSLQDLSNDKQNHQYSVYSGKIESSSGFDFSSDATSASIPLETVISPNPNVRIRLTSNTLNVAIRSSGVTSTKVCPNNKHRHQDGNCYNENPIHPNCK